MCVFLRLCLKRKEKKKKRKKKKKKKRRERKRKEKKRDTKRGTINTWVAVQFVSACTLSKSEDVASGGGAVVSVISVSVLKEALRIVVLLRLCELQTGSGISGTDHVWF